MNRSIPTAMTMRVTTNTFNEAVTSISQDRNTTVNLDPNTTVDQKRVNRKCVHYFGFWMPKTIIFYSFHITFLN